MNSDNRADALDEAVMLVVELQLGRDRVGIDQHLTGDLEADSFDIMNIVAILEEDHGVVITEEAATTVETVGDLIQLVRSLRQP